MGPTQVSREILEERKGKELRKIESAITLDINFERQVELAPEHPRPRIPACELKPGRMTERQGYHIGSALAL